MSLLIPYKLSNLDIDISKNWAAKKIENLGAPDTGDDAKRHDSPPATHGAAQHTDVTRELFIPATLGYVEAGAVGDYHNYHAVVSGGASAAEPVVYFDFKVPDDFVSFSSFKVVWEADAVVDVQIRILTEYGAEGESPMNHTDSGLPTTINNPTADRFMVSAIEELDMPDLARGDYVGAKFYRYDTDAATFYLYGLLFTYTAEQ